MSQGFLWGLSYFSDLPWEVGFLGWHPPNSEGCVVLDCGRTRGAGREWGAGKEGDLGQLCLFSRTRSGKHMPVRGQTLPAPVIFVPCNSRQIIMPLVAFETCSFEPKLGLFHKIPYLELKAHSDLFPIHCKLLFHCQSSVALSYRTQVRFC